jgi:endonuclease YncB( thermonuclease family)
MFLSRSFSRPIRHTVLGSPPRLFGLVFVLGLAVGTLIPMRDHLPSNSPWTKVAASPAIPSNPLPPAVPTSWSREGNPGVRHSVEVVRVIDGDTFEARVHLWPGLEMTTRVRLRGIDAPEMKGACGEEQRMAEAASEALRAQLADGDVAIFNIGPDKYNGRVIADAATRRTPSVSGALLASGHARQYQGGRRGGWCAVSAR